MNPAHPTNPPAVSQNALVTVGDWLGHAASQRATATAYIDADAHHS